MVLLHGSHAEIVHMSNWFWPVMLASLAKLPNIPVWHEILWLRIAPANPLQTTAFWSALSASFWASGKSSCKMSQTRWLSGSVARKGKLQTSIRRPTEVTSQWHQWHQWHHWCPLDPSQKPWDILAQWDYDGFPWIPAKPASLQASKPPSLQPSQTLLPNSPSDQVTDTNNLSSLHRWKCWNDWWHCELENSSW